MRAPPVLRSQITHGVLSLVCSSARTATRARRAADLALLHFLLELQIADAGTARRRAFTATAVKRNADVSWNVRQTSTCPASTGTMDPSDCTGAVTMIDWPCTPMSCTGNALSVLAFGDADRKMLAVAARVVVAVERVERILFGGRRFFLFAFGGAAGFSCRAVGLVAMVAVAHEHVAQSIALDHAALGQQQLAIGRENRERQRFADDDSIVVHARGHDVPFREALRTAAAFLEAGRVRNVKCARKAVSV